MSIVFSVIILILVTLIQVSMQLTPGVFTLFYHYALGKKTRKKADHFTLFYILGVETFLAIVWFMILLIFLSIIPQFFIWILAGILVAESTISLFFYYRKGPGTALFIPRSSAKVLDAHAQNIKTRSDAFSLGFFTGLPELIFTVPLYLLAMIILTDTLIMSYGLFIIIYMVATIAPLFIIHALYCTDHNLSEIERLRVKTKPLIRFFLFVGYLLLAVLTINLGVINYG